MIFEEKQIVNFVSADGKNRFGVVELIKEHTLWISQIIYKGGYVSRKEDIIWNFGVMTVDEFRNKYPEHNI